MNELIARIESGTRPVTRFLEAHNASMLRVVVLSEHLDRMVLDEQCWPQ